jgi:hypothetical protein
MLGQPGTPFLVGTEHADGNKQMGIFLQRVDFREELTRD